MKSWECSLCIIELPPLAVVGGGNILFENEKFLSRVEDY